MRLCRRKKAEELKPNRLDAIHRFVLFVTSRLYLRGCPTEDRMAAELLLLDYAGPVPTPRRSLIGACWRFACALVVFVIVLAVVIVRTALLVAGVTCLFAG